MVQETSIACRSVFFAHRDATRVFKNLSIEVSSGEEVRWSVALGCRQVTINKALPAGGR
jgi:hypothetical protein